MLKAEPTWIFMIPATSVEEEEMENFHSDLQRPFLRNHPTLSYLHHSFKTLTECIDQRLLNVSVPALQLLRKRGKITAVICRISEFTCNSLAVYQKCLNEGNSPK